MMSTCSQRHSGSPAQPGPEKLRAKHSAGQTQLGPEIARAVGGRGCLGRLRAGGVCQRPGGHSATAAGRPLSHICRNRHPSGREVQHPQKLPLPPT
eukprot:scaffold29029_cov73-Isochrysis_galbana.AAC.2